MSIPFVSSCDNHIYEDASWHSWTPGMVYCSNGEIMSYENCVAKGNTPEAVLFFVDKEDLFSGKAYAVALKDYPSKEFIDPDTTYFAAAYLCDSMHRLWLIFYWHRRSRWYMSCSAVACLQD